MTLTLGLALGSGGARGWCHIGVLRALADQGIDPDCVVGCSMGAVVGAAWAAGKVDELEEWALGMTRSRFMGFVDLRFNGGGLVGGAALTDVMTDLGLPERIEDLDRPFISVATDMATGREVWLREGSLADAIRASISIPGVFRPHRVGEQWLLDGGLVNPVPTSACRALGASHVIAVNPNAKHGRPLWKAERPKSLWDTLVTQEFRDKMPEALRNFLQAGDELEPKAPSYVDVVSTSIDVMTEYLRLTRQASDPPHVLLEANLTDLSVLDLYKAAEAIEEGRRITEQAASEIKRALDR